MQHARISVKHLTTVLALAAKLIQSSSVVNTGIWTKPRQPQEWQTAWPPAGELPGPHDPSGPLKTSSAGMGATGGGKAAARLREQWGWRAAMLPGRRRAGEHPGESCQPWGSCRALSPAGASEHHVAKSSPGAHPLSPGDPLLRRKGDQPDQHHSWSLPGGAQDRCCARATEGSGHGQRQVTKLPLLHGHSAGRSPAQAMGTARHSARSRPPGPRYTHTVLLPTLFILLIFQ